jgi:hypothetical protein
MIDSVKFKNFVAALNELCVQHGVVLTSPGGDIVVIDSDVPDAELARAEVFDATRDDSAHG